MYYYSTNGQSPKLDFKEAAILGLAPDRGLYFPETIPQHDDAFFAAIETYSITEIGMRVMAPYVGDAIPAGELERIIEETLSFELPIVPVTRQISALELYHGPTLAFKDVGARFMSRCLGHFVKDRKEKVVVLVATSGDTGGAVANGFHGVPGVEVVILYPSGKVSKVQEQQLTTPGENVRALEVKGTFDDCQRMVKTAFADKDLTQRIFLTSANSINIARWLPQQLYYFLAFRQWPDKQQPPVISVPSGNFGNICAGILAQRSGLPVAHFIAACNANDVVPRFQQSGTYTIQPAVATLSNAMDIGDPSNFIRILELFGHDAAALAKLMSSCSISDADTKATIKTVYEREGYTLDPHGAVAYLALQQYLDTHPGMKGLFLETAHPVKFNTVVEDVTGTIVPLPDSMKEIMALPKKAVMIEAGYEFLKEELLKE